MRRWVRSTLLIQAGATVAFLYASRAFFENLVGFDMTDIVVPQAMSIFPALFVTVMFTVACTVGFWWILGAVFAGLFKHLGYSAYAAERNSLWAVWLAVLPSSWLVYTLAWYPGHWLAASMLLALILLAAGLWCQRRHAQSSSRPASP